MMKRICCFALCLVLCCVLLPAGVLADGAAFGAQLSGDAEMLYGAMNADPEILRALRAGESFQLSFDGPFADPNARANDLVNAIAPAFSALELDHMDLFWLQGLSANISGNIYRLVMTVTPGLAANWGSGERSIAADSDALSAAVRRIAAEAAARGGPYDQLCYVHDWLTEHNVYHTDAADRMESYASYDFLPWSPLSALTDASQPVCEGYAKAFKLICDELGVPCVFVAGHLRGGNHAWNEVWLDGNWYAVDVTTDDPIVPGVSSVISGAECRDSFLVGANTVVDGSAFSASHAADGEYLIGVSFRYPELAAEAYSPSNAAPIPEAPDDDPPAPPFLDVPAGTAYYDAVRWAYYAAPQVTAGMDGTHFGPDSTVTRGQAVTFLWRAMGCPEPYAALTGFEDVQETDYFYRAVLWAVERGITLGTDENHFSPAQTCSTAHIVTFLYRALGVGENGWYTEARDWAESEGVLDPSGPEVAPDVDCPRAEVVLYLYRELAV